MPSRRTWRRTHDRSRQTHPDRRQAGTAVRAPLRSTRWSACGARSAIPQEMASWFPSNVEGERAVGAELTFVDDAQRAAAIEAGEPTRDEGPHVPRPRGRRTTRRRCSRSPGAASSLALRAAPGRRRDGARVHADPQPPSVAARNGSGWHMCLGSLDALLGVAARSPTAGRTCTTTTSSAWAPRSAPRATADR